MIKLTINGKSVSQNQLARELTKAAATEIEKQISAKVRAVARRHGGVTVRFDHKANGIPTAMRLQGSGDAIAAAQAALKD
jgi:hypothetical protein